MIEIFKLDMFSPHLESKFKAGHEAGGPTVELVLVSARDVGSTARQEQFSIVFRGPLDTFLQQGTYLIEHESMGSFELFLVPIKKDDNGFYYEAIFNRMLSAPAND